MRRVGVHLGTIGVLVAQHVAGKLDDHHLHAETDAEGGNVVRAAVLGGDDLALDAALSEAGADDDARHALYFGGNVLRRQVLTVDEVNLRLYIIIYACQVQTLAYRLVGVLQVVLAHQSDVYLALGVALLVQEVVPGLHGRRLSHGDANLAQDGRVESLSLHAHRYLVDARHVLALYDALQVDITERRHLQAHRVVEVAFRSQHKDVGLDAHALQFLDAVLRRLRLQLVGGLQIGDIGQVYADGIAPQFPPQLSDGLHERRTLDVANGAAHLGDDKVVIRGEW